MFWMIAFFILLQIPSGIAVAAIIKWWVKKKYVAPITLTAPLSPENVGNLDPYERGAAESQLENHRFHYQLKVGLVAAVLMMLLTVIVLVYFYHSGKNKAAAETLAWCEETYVGTLKKPSLEVVYQTRRHIGDNVYVLCVNGKSNEPCAYYSLPGEKIRQALSLIPLPTKQGEASMPFRFVHGSTFAEWVVVTMPTLSPQPDKPKVTSSTESTPTSKRKDPEFQSDQEQALEVLQQEGALTPQSPPPTPPALPTPKEQVERPTRKAAPPASKPSATKTPTTAAKAGRASG
jgi:hypothetical protein